MLHRLDGPFDLVYVDAVKTEYRRYLDLVAAQAAGGRRHRLRQPALGRAASPSPPDEEDRDADALRAFNGYLMMHPQLQAVVLPLGDGVGRRHQDKPTIMEMGGPF